MEQYGNLPENALVKKVQIGDYVAYDPTKGVTDTSKLTYTSPIGSGPSHGNGHSEQTFTANNTTEWRVLSKNETTGEVVLISAEPIGNEAGEGFFMKGAIGYLYLEQELNEICKIYGYGTGADTTKIFTYETGDVIEGLDKGTIIGSGARSISADDVNKITGYDPTTFSGVYEGVPYKYGDSYTHTILYLTKLAQDGKSTIAKERSDIDTSYYYDAYEYITDITSNIYQVLFRDKMNSNDTLYWLASRGICSDLNGSAFVAYVVANAGVDWSNLCYTNSNSTLERESDRDIRPIVYLKSNVCTNEKNENGAWIISE